MLKVPNTPIFYGHWHEICRIYMDLLTTKIHGSNHYLSRTKDACGCCERCGLSGSGWPGGWIWKYPGVATGGHVQSHNPKRGHISLDAHTRSLALVKLNVITHIYIYIYMWATPWSVIYHTPTQMHFCSCRYFSAPSGFSPSPTHIKQDHPGWCPEIWTKSTTEITDHVDPKNFQVADLSYHIFFWFWDVLIEIGTDPDGADGFLNWMKGLFQRNTSVCWWEPLFTVTCLLDQSIAWTNLSENLRLDG